MFDTPPRYRSYLLTLWEERSQDPDLPSVWRFRLEDPRTGQQRGFADLDELFEFLRLSTAGPGEGRQTPVRKGVIDADLAHPLASQS